MRKNAAGCPIITLRRLPRYLAFAEAMAGQEWEYVTSADIARACDVGELLVRKDLSYVDISGRPHCGYPISQFIKALKDVIGWNTLRPLALIAGENMSKTLISGFPFARYGVKVAVIVNAELASKGPSFNGIPVVTAPEFAERQKTDPVRLALLAVPVEIAQHAADDLISWGVKALWNFTAIRLAADPGAKIVDAELGADLAELANSLMEAGY